MNKITRDLSDTGHSPFGAMQNFIITVPGVTKSIKSRKVHKVHKVHADADGIVPRLLFKFLEQLAPPFIFIFNKTIVSGIVSEH